MIADKIITPTWEKTLCHKSVSINAKSAMVFLFRSGVKFFAIPNIAWATMAVATIFRPCIQPAFPMSKKSIILAKIIRAITEGNVNPKKEIIPPRSPPRKIPIPIPT